MSESHYKIENPADADPELLALPASGAESLRLHLPDAPHRPGQEPRLLGEPTESGLLPGPMRRVGHMQP